MCPTSYAVECWEALVPLRLVVDNVLLSGMSDCAHRVSYFLTIEIIYIQHR